MRAVSRFGLIFLLVLSGLRTAEAARISVNELNEGGGTIINDGSGDVASSNGTTTLSTSNTDLLSALGLTNLNLAADLAKLHVTGAITDPFPQNTNNLPAVGATLNVLRITGTLATGECATCGLLTDVNVGSSLGLRPVGGSTTGFDAKNVLFAFDIVGSGGFPNEPWGLPGATFGAQTVGIGAPLDYQLTQAQIQLIVARLAQYNLGVNDVRLGLGAGAAGFLASGGYEGVEANFEVKPVPEPGTLMLIGTGLAGLGLRRVRRPRH